MSQASMDPFSSELAWKSRDQESFIGLVSHLSFRVEHMHRNAKMRLWFLSQRVGHYDTRCASL